MRRLVLIGAAEGPWCGISWVKNPALHICGLEEGTIDVELITPSGTRRIDNFSCDGVHSLATEVFLEYDWIKVSSSHPSRSLICTVIPKAA